jgi:uncharacterized protein YndB with AHSA1/START domain
MQQEEKDSVAITNEFKVPPALVWKAWTEPREVSKWFGSDPKGKVISAEIDLRPGGQFEISFENSDGSPHTCSGMYTLVEPFTSLQFTWQWKSEPGVESQVRIELSPTEHSTRMNFEHVQLGTKSAHNYPEGWRRTFSKLEQLFKE